MTGTYFHEAVAELLHRLALEIARDSSGLAGTRAAVFKHRFDIRIDAE